MAIFNSYFDITRGYTRYHDIYSWMCETQKRPMDRVDSDDHIKQIREFPGLVNVDRKL